MTYLTFIFIAMTYLTVLNELLLDFVTNLICREKFLLIKNIGFSFSGLFINGYQKTEDCP